MNTNVEPYRTPNEIGAVTGESGRTIRRKAADGLLPYYRLSGKTIRFKLSEVEAVLTRLRIPARAEGQ